MSTRAWALIIGGIIPAVVLGCFGFLQKASVKNGATPAVFMTVAGFTIGLCGLVHWLGGGAAVPGWRTVFVCAVTGLAWFVGVSLVVVAVQRFDASISQLTPLYNMNTLVVVALGMLVYAEHKDVRPLPLILGAVLVMLGGALVARA
jgi:transporter family protein